RASGRLAGARRDRCGCGGAGLPACPAGWLDWRIISGRLILPLQTGVALLSDIASHSRLPRRASLSDTSVLVCHLSPESEADCIIQQKDWPTRRSAIRTRAPSVQDS